jgi:hypothetical protein
MVTFVLEYLAVPYKVRAWGSVVVKELRLLVGRSRDRSPVENFSVAFDNSMCPALTRPLKMSTRILLGVKMAGAKADNLPSSSVDVTESGSLNLSGPSGPHRPVMGMLYLFTLQS